MSNARSINLLSTSARVEVPFIKVTIGKYTFGVYNKASKLESDGYGNYILNQIQYPNYIQRLSIHKINGTFNTYDLEIAYAVTANDDPNFFEKVFSSVSQTRKITFSYGDMSAPTFIYKDEEALITSVKHNIDINSSVIRYTVKAISSGALVSLGSYTFEAAYAKPSDVIKSLLYERPDLGLLEVFYGMQDRGLVEQEGLILGDDIAVPLQKQSNISAFDYLKYLVSKMRRQRYPMESLSNPELYSLTIIDDTSGKFGGPYFKISKVKKLKEMSYAYEIDVGFPSQNAVVSYSCVDDETYALLFNFSNELQDSTYVQRINDQGELEEKYAPNLISGTANRLAEDADLNWWTSVTSFPIKLDLVIRGLLRPAILMSHVRLNVYFWGRKYKDSGLYIVTKQEDEVSTSGYRTRLSLTRVGGDDEEE